MASALYALLGFFTREPPFQPFVDKHIIYPFFVPIAPYWAEVETDVFELVGLNPDTTYRIFPPETFYPPAFPVLHKGHASHLFFLALGIAVQICQYLGWYPLTLSRYGDRLVRRARSHSIVLWAITLVLVCWARQALMVAATLQYYRDHKASSMIWTSILTSWL
ncbi:hypothetical protein PG991_011894 [Apiospora marii]|uniref:Uncharacterized protein n=1 Tax=Apiospora marii TaxID=335849 RepID=A0ABR1RFJ1_9PEZI